MGTNSWDVYWQVDIEAEHCDDCLRLSQEWNPLQIRDGQIMAVEKMTQQQLNHLKALLVLAKVA